MELLRFDRGEEEGRVREACMHPILGPFQSDIWHDSELFELIHSDSLRWSVLAAVRLKL